MNEKNLDYLLNQIKFTGFGENHAEALMEQMGKEEAQFNLYHPADFGNDHTVATLQFGKSTETDRYFFNRFTLMLKTEKSPEPITQTFFIHHHQSNITLKEAYNLMCGRAVYKEMTAKSGEKYDAWLQMNFKEKDQWGNFRIKQFSTNYGFDLVSTLGKFPIKEVSDHFERAYLLESLQRGNRQSVIYRYPDREEKLFIEAAPQFKSLHFFDQQMHPIRPEESIPRSGEELPPPEGALREADETKRDPDDEESLDSISGILKEKKIPLKHHIPRK